MDAKRLHLTQGSRHPDWERFYRQRVEPAPWDYARLDPDLENALASLGIWEGTFLDVGTGTGSQARELAARGFRVTATDISPSAIAEATASGGAARFVVDDVLRPKLEGQFDFVFDRGCFHVLEPEKHALYREGIARLTKAGGRLFLKCFSDEEPLRDFGPRRLSPRELTEALTPEFAAEAILPAEFQGATPRHPRALFGIFRRRQT